MAVTIFGLTALTVAIFGLTEIAAYATQILPRSLAGETLDPYHPGNGTLSTLLRRSFLLEPELNPHPWASAPWGYYFLQTFTTVTILTIPLLALSRSANSKHDFAWFVTVLLLASPNTASYTFILLLLPVTLLLDEARARKRVFLVACYILLTYPTRSEWNWLFSKLWLLLALVAVAGQPLLAHAARWRQAAAGVFAALLL